ncbi:MAG: response regulator [Lewinellaceae bacterium]|nr:response regulator [Lewinellaceae bacterium]
MPIAVAFLVLLLCAPWLAQPQGASTLLSVNEGLSQGLVSEIIQSRDGFLWIATKDGLNRYDGYRFEVFSPDPFDPFAIAASEILDIFEDSRGWIWVRFPGKLDIYDRDSGRFFHLAGRLIPRLSGWEDVFSLGETADGAVWFTNKGKVWKIEVPPGVLEKAAEAGNAFPKLSCQAVGAALPASAPDSALEFSSLFFTRKKALLASSARGLFRASNGAGQLQPEAFPGMPAQVLGEDEKGQVWVRVEPPAAGKAPGKNERQSRQEAEPGLWVWKGPSAAPRRVGGLPPPLDHSQFDQDGYLWGIQGKTLYKWRPEVFAAGGKPEYEWASGDPAIQNPIIDFRCLAFDRSGIAWVGTNGLGVLKINPEKPKFNSYLPGISQYYLIEGPQGAIFTQTGGYKMYASRNFNRSEPNPWYVNLPEKWKDMQPTFDAAGNCWGNPEKDVLVRIDAQTKAVKQFQWPGMGQLLFAKNGKLLRFGEEGLSQFDPLTEQKKDFPFSQPQKTAPDSRFFRNLYEGSEGVVWVFGIQGLIQATPSGGGYRYEYFKNDPSDRSSLSYDIVLSVAEDPLEPGRYLWVGTKSGGLNRLGRQTGQFKHYKREQGLPDNVIYGILPDDSGHIWLSTNKGLCRFHVREETVKNFTFADGLQDNEFNSTSYLKMKDGTLIFGGVRGLTVFHPDSLRFNEHVPQTHIVGLKVNNQPIAGFTRFGGPKPFQQAKAKIVFSYSENLITFEFAALEFTNPARNRYRYQLIRHRTLGNGSGEKWVELGPENSVQFAGLQPGSYTFRVLGSNNDPDGRQGWSEQPAELSFVIRPPWWATWWAYLSYAIAVILALIAIRNYELRRKLAATEARRLRELDDFKNRFFTNITHEFRTPLTVVLGTAEQVEPAVDEKLKPKLRLIRRNGQNLLRLINQILDLAKLESNTLKINYVQGDILPFLRYITESLHSFANAQNVMLRVKSDEASIVMDYDPERLLQIVYNLLSNAIKFTPSGGRVELRVTVITADGGRWTAPSAVITVADTGAGISSEDVPHIFDRFFQASNLEKAKAGGTGIGLALTKELVQAMGGEIIVESQVSKGTTFAVRLPITNNAQASSQAAWSRPAATEMPKAAPSVLPGRASAKEGRLSNHPTLQPSSHPTIQQSNNILIIEDNPDVVEYLAACLSSPLGGSREEAYTLDFAYNGRAGIEKALETVPDLIVSDVMMPEKDGFEVVETLKNDERTSHIPIVLLTAKADVESRIKGLRRGADAYLAKPFHEEELLATLNNLLELRRKLQAKYASVSDIKSQGQDAGPSADEELPYEMEGAFLQKAREVILEHLSDPRFSVDSLCRSLAMSQPQLHRKLTALTGKNATLFIRSVRLAKAKELLRAGTMTVSEVAYAVGFNDPKYFSRVFAEEFGVSPSKY